MVKLQHLLNKKQNKEAFTLSVPHEIVKLLGLKKGEEFAVQFDQKKGSIEYIPVKKEP